MTTSKLRIKLMRLPRDGNSLQRIVAGPPGAVTNERLRRAFIDEPYCINEITDCQSDVVGIIGGAVLTALMGYISDQSTIRAAMWVPAACFSVVAVFGLFDAQRAPRTTRPSQITVGIES
jgi:hypothetical protein